MPRKKRLLGTVPMRGTAWEDLTLDQQKLIETAYGQGSLSQPVWAKIEAATAVYASFTALERAVPIDDFLCKLAQIRTAACELNKCLPEMPSRKQKPIAPHLKDLERQFAIEDKYFRVQKLDWTPVFPFNIYELLSHTLAAVEDVVCFAESEFSDQKIGYFRGKMWAYWIRWLTIIMKEHGLPYSARKDLDKRKGDISSFVLFVQELQKHVATEGRQTVASVDALAQSINRARRGMDNKRKFSDVFRLEMMNTDTAFWILLEDTAIPVSKGPQFVAALEKLLHSVRPHGS